MSQIARDTKAPSLGFLLFGNLLAWWLAAIIANANLDGYGDMLETFTWGQRWNWSNFKHPPLSGWVAALWFDLFPHNDAFYYLLSCVIVVAGVAGVVLLARQWLSAERRWLAALMLLLAFPYSTLAYKFNANAILLLTWPWAAYFFARSLHHRQWWATVGLGLFGALAMLGKYYSGLLLVTFFLASLLTPSGRSWYKTPHPYAAGGIFLLAMIPHMQWVFHHDFVTFKYVEEQGEGYVDYSQIVRFFFAPLLYWGIPWLLTLWTCYEGPFWRRAVDSVSWKGADDLLFWLCVLPWLISLIFGISGFVALSLPWAIPIGFAYSILWLRNATATQKIGLATARFRRILPGYFVAVVLLVGVAYAVIQARNGSENYYLPRKEFTAEVMSRWQQRHPDIRLGWVGGEWAANGMIPFYGDASIIAIPNVPDQFPATIAPLKDWQTMGGVMICVDGPAQHPPGAQDCRKPIETWLHDKGQPSEGEAIIVQRTGVRFPKPQAWRYWAYWYVPTQITESHPKAGVNPASAP
ncbi:MAG: glycosyltransferase family 39 protein [Stenotrophobium sp.]